MSWSDIKHIDVPFLTPFSYSHRTHKLCQLPNGLLVLLISDPTEKSSACSLTVAAGSYCDLDDVPGVAHLCEHMILAGGSRKYPHPGFFHDLISANNGSHNAFTTGDQTTFYFELPDFHQATETSFGTAIDVFVSFFLDPLFDHTLIDKEIYAIQSEHDVNVSNASKIMYHATRLLGDKSHPFSRFATGNISTLKNRIHSKKLSLRRLIMNYFKEHYIPSGMTACIRGPQSVNWLTKLAISEFGQLRPHRRSQRWSQMKMQEGGSLPFEQSSSSNLDILYDTWAGSKAATKCFTSDPHHNTILVDSSKSQVARFLFPVWQKNVRFTRSDFLIYGRLWFELFGDESVGSFHHFLMEKGWITGCYAYTSRISINNMSLVLELSLTNSGWRNIKMIAEILVFQLVPKFSRENTVQLARFLSEQLSIDLVRFLYATADGSPMTECSNLSEFLQEDLRGVDISRLFLGFPTMLHEQSPYGFFSENEESQKWWIGHAIKFQSFLKAFMIHSSMRIILLGSVENSPLKGLGVLASMDPFYEFSYYTFDLNLERFEVDTLNCYTFSVPPKNEYKPCWANTFTDLIKELNHSLSRSQHASLGFSIKTDEILKPPQLVFHNEKYEMWVLPDSSILAERLETVVSFEISANEMRPSPENTVKLEIFAQIININLACHFYPFIKLGFCYEIYPSIKGDVRLGFSLSGFSDKLGNVIEYLGDVFGENQTEDSFPSKTLFRKARVMVRRNYEKAEDSSGLNLASIGLLVAMESCTWSLEERLDALEKIDLQSFKAFSSIFASRRKFLTLFIQGNFLQADEINSCLNRHITGHLRGNHEKIQQKPRTVRTTLLRSSTNCYLEYTGRKDDPTNSIVYFIQTGARDDRQTYTLTALSDYLMSFTLVPELRGRKQVGYAVISGVRLLTDAIGLHIGITSSLEPLVLEEKINEYLLYLERKALTPMSEVTFKDRYVNKFSRLLAEGGWEKLRKNSGEEDLNDEITASVQNGDFDILNSATMRRHRRLRNQIIDKRYLFSDKSYMLDMTLLQELTLDQYLVFFREKISIHSSTRAKISIMIKTPLSSMEKLNRQVFAQVDTFLKIHGLAIEATKLHEIVERSNGSSKLLVKELYQCFHSRRETWKLCSGILRELLKTISVNLRPSHQRHSGATVSELDSIPAVKLILIEDINIRKRELL